MIIEVIDTSDSYNFDYIIHNTSNECFRRGKFKGSLVQLRLSLLPEGKYQFSFFINENLITTIPFEKNSASFDKFQLIEK
jgi:hypothetical protein